MKEVSCTMDTLVSLNRKTSVRRGKIIGPCAQVKGKTVALVEWTDKKIERVDINLLLTKEEGDVIAAELKVKADAKNAEAKRKRERIESLEQEFQKVYDEVNPQIQEKLKQAAHLVNEAEELSEKYALPFRSDYGTPFQMSFIPDSAAKRWADLYGDNDGFIGDLTGAYGGEYTGWQSSQVC